MSFNIIGTGMSVPSKVVTNDDLSKIVDTSDEWIQQRTGIKERRVCTTETITDLCVNSAKIALENANISATDLDLIIVATISSQYSTPSQACIVQMEIGAKCPAFDINAACSGFVYALDIADGFFARDRVENVLVIAADQLTGMVDFEDRGTCVLFGDGAGAVVLGKGDSLKAISLTAKGNINALFAPKGENTSPFITYEKHQKPVLNMDGHEVYKFAVSSMVREMKKVIKEAGLTQDDIDYVIPHQANERIIDAAISKLNIPPEKYIKNVSYFGNTSASCMPIALSQANDKQLFKKGDKICLCSFGAGLTTGSCVIEWK